MSTISTAPFVPLTKIKYTSKVLTHDANGRGQAGMLHCWYGLHSTRYWLNAVLVLLWARRFDEFQTDISNGRRDPKCNNLYDVFVNIRCVTGCAT
eukprot:85755-Pelagomonas_calceolata.AAC.1